MIQVPNPDLDLTIARVIKAPRSVIWSAWTDPRSFEQWWIPRAGQVQSPGDGSPPRRLARDADEREGR